MDLQHAKKPEKKKSLLWLYIVIGVTSALIIALAAYMIHIVSQLHHQELDPNQLGVTVRDDSSDRSITNIALFGIDQRAGETQFRSDAIIVASVDKEHNKIKLSSLMRDTLADIEGHGQNKLGHAYFYGGPQLAVKTLNQNFGLDIMEYATVNFQQMAAIIDAVGGVDIDLSQSEVKDANNSIWEQAQVAGLPPTPIEAPGLQTLNGTQAVAFARIRHVGNADFERTSRQREVLGKVFQKALNMNPLQYPEFARKFLPTVETSLSFGEILGLAGIMLRDITLEEARFPTNADLIGSGVLEINGTQFLNADIEACRQKLQAFIYDDVIPEE